MSSGLEPNEISEALRGLVSGEVFGKKHERAAYATDASPYEILPLCVVLPKSVDDVVRVVRYAYKHRIPLIPRGGGSGLVGAAIGEGIVLDFTKYMRNVLSVDEHSIWCEPGIYRDNLEEIVNRTKGLSMPADPSSSAYCTVGGMIGTNASGAHSIKYGHTIDYLEAVDLVLYDGTIVQLSSVSLDGVEWEAIRREKEGPTTQRSRIYNQLFDLLRPDLGYIQSSMPKVSKNSAGYRLDKAIDEESRIFNPAKVVCGAEGTFGIVVRVKFRLIKRPGKKGFLLLRYDSYSEMGNAIPSITKFHPSAVELMDRGVIDAASKLNPSVKELNKGKLIAVIVEFDGTNEGEILEKLSALQREISIEKKNNKSDIVTDQEQI